MCYEVKIHWSAADYTDLLVLPGKERQKKSMKSKKERNRKPNGIKTLRLVLGIF